MKPLAIALAVLLVLIQYPLWLGKGSWARVWETSRQLKAAQDSNDKLRQRNAALDAEVRDLKQGSDAVEERARNELGMIKKDEVFYQVLEQAPIPQNPAQPSGRTVPASGVPAAPASAATSNNSATTSPATTPKP